MSENNPLRPGTGPLPRILLAEDEPDLRQQTTQMLTTCGYQVDAVEDGVAAWNRLQLTTYDLLITDNKMPNLSGFGLLQLLHDARVTLPVILATDTFLWEKFKLHPWLEIQATLLKPYTFNELLDAVNNVLHAHNHGRMEIAPPDWRRPPPAGDRRRE